MMMRRGAWGRPRTREWSAMRLLRLASPLTLARAARGTAFSLLVATTALAGACSNDDFDTTPRKSGPDVTLGDQMYGVLCDRVAATADPADLEGRRSRAVCRPDDSGAYKDTYDDGDGDMPAKVGVMVRYRKDLIDAFNATFPDKDSLHQDMLDL